MVESKAELAERLTAMTASRDRQVGYLNAAETRIDELETALLGKAEELAALKQEHDALCARMAQPFHVLMAYGEGEEFWWPVGLYSDHGTMQRAIAVMRGIWGITASSGQEDPVYLDRPLPAWAAAIEEGSTTNLYVQPVGMERIESETREGQPFVVLLLHPEEDPVPYGATWEREAIDAPTDIWRYMETYRPGVCTPHDGALVLADSPDDAKQQAAVLIEAWNRKERARWQQP